MLHLVNRKDSPGTLLNFEFLPQGHYDSLDGFYAISLEWFFVERVTRGYLTHSYALGNNGEFTAQMFHNMDTQDAQTLKKAFSSPIESWFVNDDWTYR